ncbi:hypothetical protein EPUS_05969 [Endocarpon pusillum Z07020]|uniref:Uncharacterized protein n=1 Tax=Endocarpon pusillum (strain Z07020 / HMAS-L-300199) TaxID=1263415 RepID=U1HLK5_ENDPU|nr:uncharacterized protein EPUS_05969 [Endocarpon pusillum Z07020]ERF71140.1 hypothetical protein EPUS_05969 [Endocarpon pusillum Z07020]
MALSLTYLAFGLASLATTSLATSGAALLEHALAPLGGRDALSSLQGVSLVANIYRSYTLMQSAISSYTDTAIATAGNASISYDLSGDIMDIRRPIAARCVFRHSKQLLMLSAYTRLLNRDAIRLSPKLLLMMEANAESLTAADIEVGGTMYPSITEEISSLTVILDPATMLPPIIPSSLAGCNMLQPGSVGKSTNPRFYPRNLVIRSETHAPTVAPRTMCSAKTAAAGE